MPRRKQPTVNYLVYCDEPPSITLDFYVQRLVGHLWYARMWKARILVPDTYTSLLIVKEADRHDIPVRVIGNNKRPRTGVNPYCRVIGGESERNQLLVMESDECFLLGAGAEPLKPLAQGLNKEVYSYQFKDGKLSK